MECQMVYEMVAEKVYLMAELMVGPMDEKMVQWLEYQMNDTMV